jgi:hypothetical protein
MTATLTPTAYTLRCGPHHASYGDPYTIAAHVQRIGKDRAHISGASGEWGPYRRAVLALLRQDGVRTVEIERMGRDGKMRTKVVEI